MFRIKCGDCWFIIPKNKSEESLLPKNQDEEFDELFLWYWDELFPLTGNEGSYVFERQPSFPEVNSSYPRCPPAIKENPTLQEVSEYCHQATQYSSAIDQSEQGGVLKKKRIPGVLKIQLPHESETPQTRQDAQRLSEIIEQIEIPEEGLEVIADDGLLYHKMLISRIEPEVPLWDSLKAFFYEILNVKDRDENIEKIGLVYFI